MYYKVKQTKKNIQKYVHPSSVNHLSCKHLHCREPKRSAKCSNFKEDDSALSGVITPFLFFCRHWIRWFRRVLFCFFSLWFSPTWTPDSYAKIFSNAVLIFKKMYIWEHCWVGTNKIFLKVVCFLFLCDNDTRGSKIWTFETNIFSKLKSNLKRL